MEIMEVNFLLTLMTLLIYDAEICLLILKPYFTIFQEYLQQFGYLPESDFETGGALRTEEELRQAVTQFQRFTGLPQTGELDANTAEMMRRPRCGMPDIEPESQSSGRRGRYVR